MLRWVLTKIFSAEYACRRLVHQFDQVETVAGFYGAKSQYKCSHCGHINSDPEWS